MWTDWWNNYQHHLATRMRLGATTLETDRFCAFTKKRTGERYDAAIRGLPTHLQLCTCGPVRQTAYSTQTHLDNEATNALQDGCWTCRPFPCFSADVILDVVACASDDNEHLLIGVTERTPHVRQCKIAAVFFGIALNVRRTSCDDVTNMGNDSRLKNVGQDSRLRKRCDELRMQQLEWTRRCRPSEYFSCWKGSCRGQFYVSRMMWFHWRSLTSWAKTCLIKTPKASAYGIRLLITRMCANPWCQGSNQRKKVKQSKAKQSKAK